MFRYKIYIIVNIWQSYTCRPLPNMVKSYNNITLLFYCSTIYLVNIYKNDICYLYWTRTPISYHVVFFKMFRTNKMVTVQNEIFTRNRSSPLFSEIFHFGTSKLMNFLFIAVFVITKFTKYHATFDHLKNELRNNSHKRRNTNLKLRSDSGLFTMHVRRAFDKRLIYSDNWQLWLKY